MKRGMIIEYLKYRADLNFEVDFGTIYIFLNTHHMSLMYKVIIPITILSIQFNSIHTFILDIKKSIYYKVCIQLDKIYIRIYNNAIRSIRTKKKCDFKENIFIMLQCRTTDSKFLRRLEPRSHK